MNMKARNLLLSALLSIAAVTPVMAHAPRPVILFSGQSTRTFTHQQLLALLGSAGRQRTSLALFLRNRNIVPGRTVPIFGFRTSLSVVRPTTHLQPIITTALSRDNLGLGHEHTVENIVSKEEDVALKEENVSVEKALNHLVEHPTIESPVEFEHPPLLSEPRVIESPKIIATNITVVKNELQPVVLELPSIRIKTPEIAVAQVQIKEIAKIDATQLENLGRIEVGRSLITEAPFVLQRKEVHLVEQQVLSAPKVAESRLVTFLGDPKVTILNEQTLELTLFAKGLLTPLLIKETLGFRF
jgi:hypothetical protein